MNTGMRHTFGRSKKDEFIEFGQVNNIYSCIVLAENGLIYGFRPSTSFMKFDSNSEVLNEINITLSISVGYATLAPNGHIYLAPNTGDKVVKFDPITESFTEIGTITGNRFQNEYLSLNLAPNGFIYGLGFENTKILKIDTNTDTVTQFGNVTSNTSDGRPSLGSVLAENSSIYGSPFTANSILKVNALNDVIDEFSTLNTFSSYTRNVLSSNGFIYSAPFNDNNILKINPVDDTYTQFGSFSGTQKFGDITLSPNGFIYMIPRNLNKIYKINPLNDNIQEFENAVNGQYLKSILAPNGFIYAFPLTGNKILKIIKDMQAPDPSDIVIPSDLSLLSISNYNRYYNK